MTVELIVYSFSSLCDTVAARDRSNLFSVSDCFQ